MGAIPPVPARGGEFSPKLRESIERVKIAHLSPDPSDYLCEACVYVSGIMLLTGVRLVLTAGGYSLRMPTGRSADGKQYELFHPTDKKFYNDLLQAVIEEYYEAVRVGKN